jgi:cobalt-zinc-cadmium efflux system protein
MGNEGHHHHHDHHHHDLQGRSLVFAVLINVALTLVQLIGGLLSGSLALVADAVHNFSDAGSLAIAAFARRVAGLPASDRMTFGFGRAEILGALVNSTSLVVVGVYLLYESFERFFHPQPVEGMTVIWVGGVAFIIDIITAFLTLRGSKDSLNIRAVFVHNLSDAFASLLVMISGGLIIWYQVFWVDLAASVLISFYILYHSYILIKECIAVLMQAVPDDINLNEVMRELRGITSVIDVHHVHIWQLHERLRSLEAHLVIEAGDIQSMEQIKVKAKSILRDRFCITHSTLELELGVRSGCVDC